MTVEGGNSNNGNYTEPEDHFSHLLEMVRDLVWSLSLTDHRVLYVNSAAEKVYGRPLTELTDHSVQWISYVHDDDQQPLQEKLDQIDQLKTFSHDFRIVQADRSNIWLNGQFQLICDDTGQPAYIGVSAHDLTQRLDTERKLEEAQAFYHSLVESLPINVFRKDKKGRIVFANQRYLDEVQFELSDILGKTDLDLFPDMAEKYMRDDAWVLRTGLPFHDIESHNKGGEMIFVEVFKAPVIDATGERIGIQGMFWDVTDRKKAEKALRDAKDMAESASRAKTDFLANVSHEIRTPMNGIIGITELLLSGTEDKERREYLELIHTSADSLLTLINDLLDFSKIEAGKIQLESKRFSLRNSLGDTLRSLAVRVHGKGLELIESYGNDVPVIIVGDLMRIRQVIINLVGNAIKFTHKGQVELRIECLKLNDGVAKLQFSVIDSGIGIPEHKLEVIFSEFEQADSSTTRQYGGTGLGLAISSKLVSLMGGKLQVESTVDQGSRFFFTADFHYDDTLIDEWSASEFQGHKATVLIENDRLRQVIGEILQRVGMNTFGSNQVSETLTLLENMAGIGGELGVFITDIDLSSNLGMELIKKIEQLKITEQMPLICLSSTATSGVTIDRSKWDITDILIKPVREQDLLNSIALSLGLISPDTTSESSSSAILLEESVAPLRILIAEDNLVNQKLAVALLKKEGHQVEVANNGRQAVLLFQQHEFDLILMDVQMPEVDGYEATREIRELQTQLGKRIPIIALTAHAGPADRQKCLSAGMDEYISKPIRVEELHARIEKMTGRPSTTTSSEDNQIVNTQSVEWEQAFETVGGDRQLLSELIKVFLKDQSQMLSNIEVALEQQDSQSLRLAAHSIKGALNHLGGRLAANFAAELELMGQENLLDEASKCLEQFRTALKQVTEEMKTFINDA